MLAEALAQVPGYEAGNPRMETARLHGGSVNRSYRVNTSAGRFVLRLSPATDAWLTRDRSVERELHGLASVAGIAPRIVHADRRDRWLITEFVAGRTWTNVEFGNRASLQRLGDTLRRLHTLPAPPRGRFGLLGVLEGYVRRIEAGARTAASHQSEAMLHHYLDEATVAWRVSGAAGREAAILHHDLHGSNIIDSAGRLLLIDWECAAVSDPLLDVACILSYHEAARPHATLLLEHCGLDEVTPQQLAAAVWLFDLHTYLWYRERRLRLLPTDAELAAEARLAARLHTDPTW